MIIYDTYRSELSFGVERDVLVLKLEQYFDDQLEFEQVFEEDEETAVNSKEKANLVLRKLKDCGWIEYETASDYKTMVNLKDYASTMIESFIKITRQDELEYQSLISQIHATLLNQDAYVKPYEYIIKRVHENTEELIVGLKKLNTNIKQYIEKLTNDKPVNEVLDDLFKYQNEIGSKSFHRIKTSDHISRFRISIRENLSRILNDENIFRKAVKGYMEIEMGDKKDELAAEQNLRQMVLGVLRAFENYDDIVKEIEEKHKKYWQSSVARAKFLISNTNNAEGKIITILKYMAQKFNMDEETNMYDEMDEEFHELFRMFPQSWLGHESVYTERITREVSPPSKLAAGIDFSDEERQEIKNRLVEKQKNKLSRKNINEYVAKLLEDKQSVVASSLPLETKRDFIKLILIYLYGKGPAAKYRSVDMDKRVVVNKFEFKDFLIERR
ncbi:MAG: Wadjet anti-phage system protein JetA family protein [Clostridia bacterium]|jgi:hypothetical protein|nr:DUF5716 family protein [Clostridia bacterium]